MGKKQNNDGFSLLEVVLSMAILALLSIPLMSYFTQSMKYNAQMADKQHASNLAQEVMEELKNQTNLVENVSGSGFDSAYLEGKGYHNVQYTPATPGSGLSGGSVEYYGAAGDIGENYDVRVKLDTGNVENVKKVPQIEGISDTRDVIALESGQRDAALRYFQAKNMAFASAYNLTAKTDREIRSHMKRTFTITVKADSVVVACSYKCDGVDGVTSENNTFECTNLAEEDIRNVEKIYLMYEVCEEQLTDELQIQCDIGVAVPKLFIVCQNMDIVNGNDTLRNNYILKITPLGCNTPKVASNLGTKSYDNSVLTNGGSIWNAGTIESLVSQTQGVRMVNIEVSVYQKNKGNEADREEYQYITVDAAKGE